MRLGINASRLYGQRTGVGRYLLNLLKQWRGGPLKFESVFLYLYRPWSDASLRLPDHFRTETLALPLPFFAWEHGWLRRRSGDVDVLFCPSYTIPLHYQGKTVVTIHDAVQELFADSFSWWSRWRFAPLYRYSARHADMVITDSHASKRDLMACYRVPEERIEVIYLAPDDLFRSLPDPQSASLIKKRYLGDAFPFILYVGKLSARRNVPVLLRAFGELKKRHRAPHKLLLVGLNYRRIDIAGLAREAGVTGDCVHVDYISDADLVGLYNAADLFVFPSSYEGFSLPILEAMACGTPVVTVNSSALTEIAQDAAFLLDECRADALAHGLYRVIAEEGLRQELIRKGLARAADFSWEKTARATMAVLERVAEAKVR